MSESNSTTPTSSTPLQDDARFSALERIVEAQGQTIEAQGRTQEAQAQMIAAQARELVALKAQRRKRTTARGSEKPQPTAKQLTTITVAAASVAGFLIELAKHYFS